MKYFIACAAIVVALQAPALGQTAQDLLSAVKTKITTVKTYTTAVRIKVDVPFLKAPESTATMYFKAPDKTHIESDGFAMIPKQGADLSAARLLSKPYSAVDMGTATFQGASLRRVKVVPLDDDPDVVVATLWIDAGLAIVRKIEVSMRAGGTVVGELVYDNAKAREYGLPSYAKLMFDVPRFELPKTMTGDFDAPAAAPGDDKKPLKANVELWYSKYEFNVVIPDSKFR
jgi:hypothetical protein